MADAVLEVTDVTASEAAESEFTHPSQYRTFSRNLAPGLTGLGGTLAILGGLGNWLRTARSTRIGEPLQDIGALMGYRTGLGWVVAAIGLVAALGSITWLWRSFFPKLVPIVAGLGIAFITIDRLSVLSARARELVGAAGRQLGFTGFHAGLGWGAWLLVISSVVTCLGLLIGILREMDIRRGLPE